MEKRYGIKIVGTAKENNTNYVKGETYTCVIGKRDFVLAACGGMWAGHEVELDNESILKNGYRQVTGAVQSLKKWKKYQEEFWENDVSIVEYEINIEWVKQTTA